MGLTESAVHRIWRAFGLAAAPPADVEAVEGPVVVDKVRDVVGLYLTPPERAVVLGVDGKSQIGSVR